MSQSSPGWSIYWAINIHLRCPGVVQNHLNNPRVQYVSEIGESDEKSGNSEKTKSVAKNDISIVEELDRTGSNRNTAVSVMLPCTLQFNFIPFLFNDDSIFCHRLLYREPYHAFKNRKNTRITLLYANIPPWTILIYFPSIIQKNWNPAACRFFSTLAMTENGGLDQITIWSDDEMLTQENAIFKNHRLNKKFKQLSPT